MMVMLLRGFTEMQELEMEYVCKHCNRNMKWIRSLVYDNVTNFTTQP